MKDALRKYIVTILLDVRGDNEFPTDEVLQANASLLLTRFQNNMQEVIGKDLQPEMRLDKGEKLRPEASLAEYGAFINYISNNTKRKMREKLDE